MRRFVSDEAVAEVPMACVRTPEISETQSIPSTPFFFYASHKESGCDPEWTFVSGLEKTRTAERDDATCPQTHPIFHQCRLNKMLVIHPHYYTVFYRYRGPGKEIKRKQQRTVKKEGKRKKKKKKRKEFQERRNIKSETTAIILAQAPPARINDLIISPASSRHFSNWGTPLTGPTMLKTHLLYSRVSISSHTHLADSLSKRRRHTYHPEWRTIPKMPLATPAGMPCPGHPPHP